MGLFSRAIPAEGKKYKGMGKSQLIEIINSQNSTIDFLQNKLDKTEQALKEAETSTQVTGNIPSTSEDQSKAVAGLTEENEKLRAQAEDLRRQLDSVNSGNENAGEAAEQNAKLTKRCEELEAEITELKKAAADSQQRSDAEIAELKKAASEISNADSIMEMSLRINGVMEAARNAADEYLVSIKKMHDEMKNEYSGFEKAAKQKADEIIQSANTEAEAIVSDAKKESNALWKSLSGVFTKYCDEKYYNVPEE